jgi:hypothetical protein
VNGENPDLGLGQGQQIDTFSSGLADPKDDDLGRRVMKDKSDDTSMVMAWRGLAKPDFAYYHAHQWNDVDRLRMEQLKRPALVFNRLKATVNAISGLERLNRMSVRFVSRALDSPMEEDLAGDLATEARETVLELCSGEQARSRAILDTIIGGMGWVSVRMGYENDLDGRVMIERLDPFEMGWDKNATQENLLDAERLWRERSFPRKLFKQFWGEDKLADVDASVPVWDERDVGRYELVTPYYSRQNEKANPLVNNWGNTQKPIQVIQYQWREYESVYRFLDPQNPDQLTEMDAEAWARLKRKFEMLGRPVPPAVRQMKPVYKQVYVANGVTLEEPTALPGNHFSLLPITGEWDTETKTWYGVIRQLRDAQDTRNKSISSALSQSLTNAKGGVIFKTSAFADPLAAKDQWAQPNAWIEATDATNIATDIVQRTPATIPQELPLFFEVSTAEISAISGINDRVIGVAQGDTSSPTERSRVQQALAVLGWLWDAVSAHTRTEARVTLEFIREFWTRGQLIQVGGQINGKAIPLFRSGLPMDYELVLDESVKHNPNLKAQVWNDLQPIIPSMLRFGFGSFVLEALKYSPLPTQVVAAMQKMAAQQPPQPPGGKRGKPQDPQEQQAKVANLSAQREKTLAQARAIDRESNAKIAELVLSAAVEGSNAQHKRGLEEHKKRQDALKLMQILKGGSGAQPGVHGNGGSGGGTT